MNDSDDRKPSVDKTEDDAYFPSPYSLSQFTSSKTDFDGTEYKNPNKDGKKKVLMIATDERYLLMKNGKMFSTGNHPVETLLPMYHMDKAGFEIEIATLSGNPVKFEWWAFPSEDEAVKSVFEKYKSKLKSPLKLDEVAGKLNDSNYEAIFAPGGHGALIGIPFSKHVKEVLKWAVSNDKLVVTLCHGPAFLLAAALGEKKEDYIFKGYKICVFPDSFDGKTLPEIGYIPGPMPWFLGEKLTELGVEILNDDVTGKCFVDRKLITGDSPLAANQVGKLAANALLEATGCVVAK
ncbi:protein deglycase HchA [Candidatus Obscuribacterales bacterium]|nr:protein deglycase HchA [Candidatus Obscuribacterales bacterium]